MPSQIALTIYEEGDEGLREAKTYTQPTGSKTVTAEDAERIANELIQYISGLPTRPDPAQGITMDLVMDEETKDRQQMSLKEGLFTITVQGQQEPVYKGAAYIRYESGNAATPASPAPTAVAPAPVPAVDPNLLKERQEKEERVRVLEGEVDTALGRILEIDRQLEQLTAERSQLDESVSTLTTEAQALKDELAKSDAEVAQLRSTLTDQVSQLAAQLSQLQAVLASLGPAAQ